MAGPSGVSRSVVLVVEDEPLLLMQAVGLVEDAGFEALEAVNADEAIALLSARPDIRIVFTDIQMPGSMDGLRLAAAVRERWPPVGIIVTSGQLRMAEIVLPERGVFVGKPYDEREVVAIMRRMAA